MSTPKRYIVTFHHKLMSSVSVGGSEEELSFSVITTLKPHIRVAAQAKDYRSCHGTGWSWFHSKQHEPQLLKLSMSEICLVNALTYQGSIDHRKWPLHGNLAQMAVSAVGPNWT